MSRTTPPAARRCRTSAPTRTSTPPQRLRDGTEIVLVPTSSSALPLQRLHRRPPPLRRHRGSATVTAAAAVTTVDVALRRVRRSPCRSPTGSTAPPPRVRRASRSAHIVLRRPPDTSPLHLLGLVSPPRSRVRCPRPAGAGTYQLFADPRTTRSDAVAGRGGRHRDREAARSSRSRRGPDQRPVCGSTRPARSRARSPTPTGAPLSDVCVWVPPCPGLQRRRMTARDRDDGTYISPVSDRMRGRWSSRGGYQWRWSGNAVNRPQATPVTVRPVRMSPRTSSCAPVAAPDHRHVPRRVRPPVRGCDRLRRVSGEAARSARRRMATCDTRSPTSRRSR